MFWVEIPGRRGLVSLPFPGKNSCLSRDFWQVEIGFSTHFAGFPCFGQRFPDGGAWNLYLFPAKTAVQVEISGRRGLVSLPISPVFAILGKDSRQAEFGFSTHFAGFPVLGRDSRQAGFGFSTHFAGFRYFGQRFPVGGIWLLYPFRRFSLFQVEIPGRQGLVSLPFSGKNHCSGRDFRHHAPQRRTPPQHAPPRHTPTTTHPTTALSPTARPTTAHSPTAHSPTAHPATV